MEGERVAVGTLSTYMRANDGTPLLAPQHHITKYMGETYARIPTACPLQNNTLSWNHPQTNRKFRLEEQCQQDDADKSAQHEPHSAENA